jgi:hypothetical protein
MFRTYGRDMGRNLPARAPLSASQLATLAGFGEERSASVGDVLYRVGDPGSAFIAIIDRRSVISCSCVQPETSAQGRTSALPPRWAQGRWPCSWSIHIARVPRSH